MFSLKEKLKNNDSSAGITLSKEGISLAIIDNANKGPLLRYAQYHRCQPNEQQSLMTELSRQFNLSNIPCNLILHPDEYQLTQVDAPEVAKQELSSALRWQIKELIDFHIDDAVIDHIELPNLNTASKKQFLVVASRKTVIQEHVNLLQASHCNLIFIDIAVQSARNIISQIPSTNASVGLLNLWDNVSKLSVILNDDIYINRASNIGQHALSLISDEELNNQSDLDTLALELQRTFDYFESHSHQAAISQLLILNNGKAAKDLSQLLQQRLGINCTNLDLRDALKISDSINRIDNNCITAIGGALRQEV